MADRVWSTLFCDLRVSDPTDQRSAALTTRRRRKKILSYQRDGCRHPNARRQCRSAAKRRETHRRGRGWRVHKIELCAPR